MEAGDVQQRAAWHEIALVAQRHVDLVANGNPRTAAIAFLDYWVGPGALLAMPEHMQAYVIGCMSAVASEFRELLRAGVVPPDFDRLTMPVLLLSGSQATQAIRGVIAELCRLLPAPRYVEIAGARHMAPLLQPDLINPLLIEFFELAAQVAHLALRRTG